MLYGLPIATVNSKVAARGDRNSPSATVQLRWLELALEDYSSRRNGKLNQVMVALETSRYRSSAAAKVYVAAKWSSGKTPTVSDLWQLRASWDQEDRLFAAAFQQPAEWHDVVAKKLPTNGLLNWVAHRANDGLKLDSTYLDGLAHSRRQPNSLYANVVGLGLLVVAGYLVATSLGMRRPPEHPELAEPASTPWQLPLRAALARAPYLVAALAVSAMGYVIPALSATAGSGAAWMAAYGIVLVSTTALMCWIPLGGRRLTLTTPGVPMQWLTLITWGVGGMFAAAGLATIATSATKAILSRFYYVPAMPFPTAVPFDRTWMIATMFSGCIAAPITEELTFRGTLLPALAAIRWLGRYRYAAAAVISSLLFAAGHSYGVPQWPAIAAIGIVQCVIVYQSGSLIPAFICHGLYNLMIEWGHMATLQVAFPQR